MLPEAGLHAPFSSPDWIYELQFEGTRCIAHVEPGRSGDTTRVLLQAVNGEVDANSRFPAIVRSLAELGGGPHVLDGTASVTHRAEATGTAGASPADSPAALCVSDLLVHAGEDLTGKSLLARQARLRELLQDCNPAALMAAGNLPADAGLLRSMVATGQGTITVIAKRKASRYQPGARSADWLVVDTGPGTASFPSNTR